MMDEVIKIYNKLLTRICLLFVRGILRAVDNSDITQKIQVTGLSSEPISDMERFEQYGMTSYPLVGAETFCCFLNGNRSQGITICIHDRRYRPTNLSEGEVCIFSFIDKTTPHRILLKNDGTIELYGTTVKVVGDITTTGDMTATGDVSDSSGIAQTMAAMRVAFNTHNHGANPANPPTTTM
jgi:phage gp45-like